jgi:hypothetical protein
MHDPYFDIRPYNDNEVSAVLEKLSQSHELRRALASYRFPKSPVWAKPVLYWLVGWHLRRRLGAMTSVDEVQAWLARWIAELIRKTTSRVEVLGLDRMVRGAPYLWLSNHRDIAMDPTLINFSLHRQGWPTAHIAIGDNLLHNPVLADVMRLNKSFVVKRSAASKREKLTELQRLSGYIKQSLDQGHSVWLAQREGRAKDSRDKTDTAVLKMLALSGRELKDDFATTLTSLRPVPVLVQYEWDPCDVLKARELVARAEGASYAKAADEDTQSVIRGLTGYKGHVRVCFGSPLKDDMLADAHAMAAEIDRQIKALAVVMPVHRAALSLLQRHFNLATDVNPGQVDDTCCRALLSRVQNEPEAVVRRLLLNYAAPLIEDETLI